MLALAAWATASPMPVPRSEVAAAPLGGRIVVVGGFLGTGANSRRTDLYDPARDSWERLPDLPVAVDHAAAASWRGKLVVVGGYSADRQPLRTAFLLEGRRWRRIPPPPQERAAAAAAATAEGKLYVAGGRTRAGLATSMLVLDFRTLRWTVLPGPVPREHLAATALGGRVYVLGGRKAGYDTNLDTVQAFDPVKRLWATLAPLPHPRGGTAAAAIGGKIVSVGGEEQEGTIAPVYALDVRTGAWSSLPALPTPRHGLGAVALRGRVWVVAGGPQPGLTVSGTVESLDMR